MATRTAEVDAGLDTGVLLRVLTDFKRGNFSVRMPEDWTGTAGKIADTLNEVIEAHQRLGQELERVGRVVGREGRITQRAAVGNLGGEWAQSVESVNELMENLVRPTSEIARVIGAVAGGDLSQTVATDLDGRPLKGQFLQTAKTVNTMVGQLNGFAGEVTRVAREVGIEGKLGGQAQVKGVGGVWKDLTDNVNLMAGQLTNQLRAIADVATSVTEGDLNREIGVEASGEVAVVKDKINQMIGNLKETTQKNAEQDWLKTNLTRFTRVLQGQRDLNTVSKMILSDVAPLVRAQHGVFYTMDQSKPEDPVLRFQAGYAYKERKTLAQVFRVGEGLVGQCALEKERILLTGVPEDYVKINSALGESAPLNIIVLPVVFEGNVRAVIELASFDRFSSIHQDFLEQLTESIGIVLNTIEANMTTEQLLKQSQSLAHELQSQQEELQTTNEELEQKARLLAEQNTEVERKNLEVEQAKRSLEEKAEQLEITSRYKSEFLANMSHELRTPLNSLLILAQQLAENHEQNLTGKQVEFAQIIRGSGQDLLNLINDILDLSKIESGTVALEIRHERISDIKDVVEKTFRHIADSKNLGFKVTTGRAVPETITTDAKRLQQVIKNLLSNAFKFTEKGRVELKIEVATSGWKPDNANLQRAGQVLMFSVTDTGIGIAKDKRQSIFEAFAQGDGSTARKYGGTGLGLSISREIVRLLGGEISLKSEVGAGTSFTVYLPAVSHLPLESEKVEPERSSPIAEIVTKELFRTPAPGTASTATVPMDIEDDRHNLGSNDRLVLILEDDPNFARVLLDVAHQNGYKGLIALQGESALLLARQYKPTAVTLDLGLRDMSGWAVLDRLKQDPETADIPVHIISVFEDGAERGQAQGASTYLTKPATSEALAGLFARIDAFIQTGGRNLLVVEDDDVQREEIIRVVSGRDVTVTAVATGKEAMAAIKSGHVDCVILDLGLPDVDGHKLIEQIHRVSGMKELPIIVYTAAELSVNAEVRLRKQAKSIIMKGGGGSRQKLLDEVSQFFGRVTASATPMAPKAVFGLSADGAQPLNDGSVTTPSRTSSTVTTEEGGLKGRKVLVVDDDVRNIFALTALLERHGMEVLHAETGREAVQLLHENPSLEVVLMDIMMPEMDGYETMAAIRRLQGFDTMPMIALTAKAMKGDREACLAAGASDYIAKPVDPEQLLSLLRVWLRS